jgi:competence protein ComEC
VLSAAVLVLLILQPDLVRSIGFQLSVSATAGMVALAAPLGDRFARWMPAPIAAAAGTTLAAQLGVTPVLLFHFHDVPGVTLVANVLAAPTVAPSLLLGLVAATAGLAAEPLGHAVGLAAQVPMRALELIATVAGRAPIAHVTSRGGPVVLVAGIGAVVALTVALRTGWRPPRRALVVAIALLPVLVWRSAAGVGPPDALTVRFFDVGQGDAALVTTPAGATVLVDGGPDEDQVATELSALGVKRLDVVVASHPHADHVVGIPSVLARFQVGVVLQPGCPSTSGLQVDVDRAIADERIDVRTPWAGESFVVGDVRLDVLSPHECYAGTESDTNNDALVIRLTRGDDVVLFATEPEQPAQEWLLEQRDAGLDLTADVLKVPHHGAATSVDAFFDAVAAPVAVVSVGENSYGHPVPTTMTALTDARSDVWRTDEHGTITVTFHDGVPTVRAER